MIILYKIRKFFSFLITGGLLILCISCEQKPPLDSFDNDNSEENINVKIKKENERLTKDRPDEEEEEEENITNDRQINKIGEKMEKAARDAGRKIRETSDMLKETVRKSNKNNN